MIFGLGLGLPLDRPAHAGENDCHTNTSAVERQLHIPNGLLLAISLVESGIDGVPQPNAVSLGARTVQTSSRADALRRIQGRDGALRRDAFVGCMQLSVRHHRGAFHSIEAMIEPKSNIWYAGHMLVRMHAETGSWSRAVARYQGGSRSQSHAYVCRVWNHLAELDWGSAKTLEPRRCGEMNPPEIAPKTRRAFQQAQVAANPE
ncbi:MAG: transglycosylase SLT domain-containing protein [Rhodospirillaceae bacterium]